MFTITEYCNTSSKYLLLKMSAPPAKKRKDRKTEKLIHFLFKYVDIESMARVPQTVTGVSC